MKYTEHPEYKRGTPRGAIKGTVTQVTHYPQYDRFKEIVSYEYDDRDWESEWWWDVLSTGIDEVGRVFYFGQQVHFDKLDKDQTWEV